MSSQPTLNDVKIAVSLIYGHSSPPSTLLLEWKEALTSIMTSDVTTEQLDYTITRASSNRIISDNVELTDESKALVLLMCQLAEKEGDASLLRSLVEIQKKYSFDENINTLLYEYHRKIKKRSYSSILKGQLTVVPLLIEQLIRLIVLFYFSNTGGLDSPLFIGFQLGIIPVGFVAFLAWRSRKIKKANQQILEELEIEEKVRLSYSGSSAFYTVLFFVFMLGSSVITLLNDRIDFDNTPFLILVVPWVIYLIFYQRNSRASLKVKEVKSQLEDRIQFSEQLGVDENDEVIVLIQGKIKSMTSRLEAYVLESALFGALAFSGFLQIMAENLVSFRDLELFASNVSSLFTNFLLFMPQDSGPYLEALGTKTALFSLISVETLFCSILFLAVIASRLMFSNIADLVNHELDLAIAFNHKEELLIGEHKMANTERINQVNRKIHERLHSAYEFLDKIHPVREYMQFFRNAGILMFLLILITSALLISPALSLIFTLLSLGTLIYFNRDRINKLLLDFRFYAQYLAVNRSYVIVVLSVIFVLFGTYVSMVHQSPYFGWALLFAFILFLTYRLVFILLVPHHDDHFKKDVAVSEFWRMWWAIAETVLLFGLFLLISGLPGAGVLFGVGLLGYLVSLFRLGFIYSNKWFLGIVCGLALATGVTSLCYKILALPGSGALGRINIALTLLLFGIGFLKQVSYHRILKNMLVGVLLLALYSPFFTTHRFCLFLQTTNIEDIQSVEQLYQKLYFFETQTVEDLQLIHGAAELISRKYTSEMNQNIHGSITWNMAFNFELSTVDTEQKAKLWVQIMDICFEMVPEEDLSGDIEVFNTAKIKLTNLKKEYDL